MKANIFSQDRNQKNNAVPAIYYSTFITRFGKYLVASTTKGICAVFFCNKVIDALTALKSRWPKATFIEKTKPSHKTVQKYFLHQKNISGIKFHLQGTDFQIKVWKALLTIPRGKTSTYAQIAKQIGRSKAVRAVGTAVGANPIGYLIPCHRVLSSDGGIGGYRWGTKIKHAMLTYEKADFIFKNARTKNKRAP